LWLEARFLDEDKIIYAIEKLFLVLDATVGLLWLVTGIAGCVLFYSQGYTLQQIGGAPSFIATCLVLGTLLFAVAFYAFIVLLTSLALAFNLFSVARLLLIARCQTTPIQALKDAVGLSIAYCLDSEGKDTEAEKVYQSLKDKRAFLRRFSPLCWGLAFDAFAEWIDSNGLLLESENWPRAHQLSQVVRHSCLIVLFAAPIVLFQNGIVMMLPGIADSYANPKIGNYQAAANALADFIWLEHIFQPNNRQVDAYKTRLAEYLILSGDYSRAESILQDMIAQCKHDGVGASTTREYVRRLSRLMDESGRADDAEKLYKEAMGSGADQTAVELLLFAEFYIDRGDHEAARRLLEKGLAGHVAPEEAAELNYQLGLVALKERQFKKGQDYFQRALDLIAAMPAPNRSRAPFYKLAWSEAAYKQGDRDQGLKSIDELASQLDAMPAKGQDAQVTLFLALAHSYDSIGQDTPAIRYMKKAITILSQLMSATNPARAESLIDLGEMYCKIDKPDSLLEARNALESALNLVVPIRNDPLMARCLIDLGAVCLKLNKQVQAQNYFARAVDQLARTGIHQMPQFSVDQLAAYRQSLSRTDRNADNIDKIFGEKRNRFTHPSSNQG